jgi:hypothetical protein
VVRLVENFHSFKQLNISRIDIHCVLDNDAGEAARSTRSVTLYITVNITPLSLYNSPPLASIPTEDADSPAEQATIPGRIELPLAAADPPVPPPHCLPVRTGTPMPQSLEGMSPTEDFLFSLSRANESMKLIVPIDRSTTWERAAERINWVMEALSPIAEVRVTPFSCLRLG